MSFHIWIFSIVLLCGVNFGGYSANALRADDPALTIRVGGNAMTWRRSELLQSKKLENIEVAEDPTYGRTVRKFEAIRAAVLFNQVATHTALVQMTKDGAVLQFTCLDGFSAQLPIHLVLNANPKKSVAYIAIESPAKKWPNLKGVHPLFKTAGPFYLIWKNAKLSNIGPEQWPYQLVSFAVKPPLARQFPKVVPNSRDERVLSGYRLFVKNCFACHTMNGEGNSRLGPDLNLPMNPTEYLRPGMIRRLIRNPQNLRQWPESKMSAFGRDVLSDRDIDRIVRYLKFMAGQKKQLGHSE